MSREEAYERAVGKAIEVYGPGTQFASREAYAAWAGPFGALIQSEMQSFDRKVTMVTRAFAGYKRSHLGD